MKSVLKWELKRYLKNRKNQFVFLMILLYILVMTGHHHIQSKTYLDEQGTHHLSKSKYHTSVSYILTNILKDMDSQSAEYDALFKRVSYTQNAGLQELTIGKLYSGGQEKDFRAINTSQNNIYALMLAAYESDVITDDDLIFENLRIDEIQAKHRYTEVLKDYEGDLYLNAYSIDGANAIRLLFSGKHLYALTLLILFSFVDMFTQDLEDGSYKLIYVMPLKRRRVIVAKTLVAVLSTLALIVIILAIYLAIAITIGGVGDFQYPVYAAVIEASTLPIATYMVIGTVFWMLVSVSMVTFLLWVSIRMRRPNVSMAVLTTIYASLALLTYFVNQESVLQRWMPFNYLFFGQVMDGFFNMSVTYGLSVNGLMILLSLALAFKTIEKVDLIDI